MANTDCDVLVLHDFDFRTILDDNPKEKARVLELGEFGFSRDLGRDDNAATAKCMVFCMYVLEINMGHSCCILMSQH